MATTSEVKKALDEFAKAIDTERRAYANAKARIETASSNLAALPSIFSDVITTIDNYAPSGAFETLSKDEKDKLGSEFMALRTTINNLIATTEFTA